MEIQAISFSDWFQNLLNKDFREDYYYTMEKTMMVKSSVVLWMYAVAVKSQEIWTTNGCRVDLCFIMDTSGSVTEPNWFISRDFVANVTKMLPISPQDSLVGQISFNDQTYFDIALQDHTSKEQLIQDILSIPYRSGGTRIDLGLQAARLECFNVANGDRLDAPNVAVMMADGNSDYASAVYEADMLRVTGASIVVIGVGGGINHDLLLAIAGNEDSLWIVDDFEDLYEITNEILGISCEASQWKVEPHSMMPVFGPISGGTLLIIDGKDLNATVELKLGPMELNFTLMNSSQIQTITPAVPANVSGYQLNVTLTALDGDQVVVPDTYEYRPDPIIIEIYPLDTIVRGGTTITTEGSYLNSIAVPLMDITLVNRTMGDETYTTFQTPCLNTTNSRMLCRTPDLTIEDNPYPEEENRTISSADLVFYLGFTLDGVETYTNISEAEGLEKYGILTVYSVPSLGKADEVITYQEGVPLHVEGSDMSSGIAMDDYIVDIGTGICVNQELTDNELICTPPATSPKHENGTESEYHRIIVHIGSNTDHYYGEMHYPKQVNELAIIVGSVVGAAVLITVLVVVSIFAVRNKNKAENPQENAQDTTQGQPSTSDIVEFPPVIDDMWNNLSVDPMTNDIAFPPVVEDIQDK